MLLHGHLLLLVHERLLCLLRLLRLLLGLRFRALPEDLSLLSLLRQEATRAAAATHEEQDEGHDDDQDHEAYDLGQAEK